MISTKQSISVCLIISVFLLCLHIKSCYIEIHTKKANNVVEEANNVVEEANNLAEEANKVVEEANKVVEEANNLAEEANTVLDDNVYDKALDDELKTKIPYWLFNVQPKGPVDSDSPINPYNAESNLGEVDFETDDSESDSE